MKIGFIGCVLSSRVALLTLINNTNKDIEIVAVITKKKSDFNSDFVDISKICKDNSIPVHYENSKEKDQSLKFMKSYKPDVIYCIGWSYLLDKSFLSIAQHGIVGFHPAYLPANRGRHPIIWSLALGLDETASSFFIMDEGADSGPIISQEKIIIDDSDNASSLYQKILEKIGPQIDEITNKFFTGAIVPKEQNHSKSNNWRKRSFKDGKIDWRMTAIDINNLVRALSEPYPGAHYEYDNKFYPVFESKVCNIKYDINIEPGKILDIKTEEHLFLIKCAGNSAIWIYNEPAIKHLQVGNYL
tara:strand:- start:53 stop:955 length:903 start_codon:yes stop_codon:yes gene_type:complete